jgi:competence protein ComEC
MFAVCAGVLLAMHIPMLVSLHWLYPAPLLLLFVMRLRPAWLAYALCGLLVGLAWGIGWAHWRMSFVLPEYLQGEDIWVEGKVVGLPKRSLRGSVSIQRFELALDSVESKSIINSKISNSNSNKINLLKPKPLRKISLSWYAGRDVSSGQHWRFKVRLKRPRGYASPGAFDYHVWLLEQGIDARGYVRTDKGNQLLAKQSRIPSLDAVRADLLKNILALLKNNDYAGVIAALVIGDKSAITEQQWQLFKASGTIHLIAISGLHVGIIALLAYWLVFQLARRCEALCLLVPAQLLACFAAIFSSAVYCALAGFSLPTTRAFIMVTVLMAGRLLKREWRPSTAILCALFIILLINPLAVHSSGFWLSFAAVAALIYGFSCRISPGGFWWRWIRPQWLVFLALSPVLLLVFYQLPWLSPLANFLAIPYFSFLVVPLALAGGLLSPLSRGIAEPVLHAAAKLIDYACKVLEWLVKQGAALESAGLRFAGLEIQTPVLQGLPLILVVVMGILLLLSPRALPGRHLAWLLLILPWLVEPDPIPQGDYVVNVLDVGQGLAVVVQTASYTLIFDTGPSYGANFDLGAAVVLPFLQSKGVDRVDRMIISHNDNDHIGGMISLLGAIPVQDLLFGEPKADLKIPEGETNKTLNPAIFTMLDSAQVRPACREGMMWVRDQVTFRVLNGGQQANKSNNSSCVIRVSSSKGAVLLAGDIEKSVEKRLVDDYGNQLQSDVLVAPHHGSKTSSSDSFLRHVDPAYAVFSVGYRNSFNHPHPDIVARYRSHNINLLNTASSGSVFLRTAGQANHFLVTLFREANHKFWYSADP